MTAVRHDARSPERWLRGASAVRELWGHLSATMRLLRQTAGTSLRTVEAESGVGRGTLSQIETGKARPNRYVVEWYDTAFGGDGMLLTMFAEARGAHGPTHAPTPVAPSYPAGDALEVVTHEPARGALVPCGSTVSVSWVVRNAGSVPWRDRRVARLGARAGIRLLSSRADDPLPDCDPGESVTLTIDVGVPAAAATYVAYWQVVDAVGDAVLPVDFALSVELVGRLF